MRENLGLEAAEVGRMLSRDELLQSVRDHLIGLPRPAKRLLTIVSDIFFISAALASALVFTAGPEALISQLRWMLVPQVALLAIPVFWLLGLYRAVVRFI